MPGALPPSYMVGVGVGWCTSRSYKYSEDLEFYLAHTDTTGNPLLPSRLYKYRLFFKKRIDRRSYEKRFY